MTARRAYEMFTRAVGSMGDWGRKDSQFPQKLIAWDDLPWQEKNAWKNLAKQIDAHAKRSSAARSTS